MRFLGIDPGVNGAVVWLDVTAQSWGYSKLGRNYSDVRAAINYSVGYDLAACTLEIVNAGGGPRKGKNSIFTQGRNFGHVEAAIYEAETDHVFRYEPRVWMLKTQCYRAGKDGIHARALEFFPKLPKYAADAAMLSILTGVETGRLQVSVFDDPETLTQQGLHHVK